MKYKLSYILLTAFVVLSMAGCSIFEVQGPEPAFITIPSLAFAHNADEGSADHTINNVEIFFEQVSIGYYEIPVTLAVIPTEEISNITIRPAIRENGGTQNITFYNMMENYSLNQKFEINEYYEIIPQFTYADNIVVNYEEGFEGGNSLSFDLDEIDSTKVIRTNKDARSGNFSGLFTTDVANKIEVGTDFVFTELPGNNRPSFVEFDYKGNSSFEVGFVAVTTGLEDLELFTYEIAKRDDWNRFYLNLTQWVAQIPSEGYRIVFKFNSSAGTVASEVFIDNIKLLHIP